MNELLLFTSSLAVNTVVTTVPIVVGVYFVIRRLMSQFIIGREQSRYDDMKREAVLSEIHASYEYRLADLTREMVATRARWEDANHLLIAGQQHQQTAPSEKAIDVDTFLKPYGIDQKSIEINTGKIFVLTPFSEKERRVYDVIKAVCTEAGFIAVRGDESRAEGDILSQILSGIVSSQIIVANVSSRNPNVFFELGIAMALGKPTILISDTLSDVPFDLQSRRIIIFKEIDDLRNKLTTALLQTVRGTSSKR